MTTHPHPDLQLLKSHLQDIHDSIAYFQPLIARPPILDSSFDAAEESNEENQWLKQENIPGLKKLKENTKIDLGILDKVISTSCFSKKKKKKEMNPYNSSFSSSLTILIVPIYLLCPRMLHTLLLYGMKFCVLRRRSCLYSKPS